jgi:hypothetical protein
MMQRRAVRALLQAAAGSLQQGTGAAGAPLAAGRPWQQQPCLDSTWGAGAVASGALASQARSKWWWSRSGPGSGGMPPAAGSERAEVLLAASDGPDDLFSSDAAGAAADSAAAVSGGGEATVAGAAAGGAAADATSAAARLAPVDTLQPADVLEAASAVVDATAAAEAAALVAAKADVWMGTRTFIDLLDWSHAGLGMPWWVLAGGQEGTHCDRGGAARGFAVQAASWVHAGCSAAARP